MKPPVSIRHAGVDDADLLASIGAETFVAAYEEQVERGVLEAYVVEAFAPRRMAAEAAAPGADFLVAETDGAVAGYAYLAAGSPPLDVRGDRPLELNRLYARPGFIGRGVGAALMQAALDEAARRGCDVLWLGVWSRNDRAIAFYRRWGFEALGRVPFDLGGVTHEDLVMARPVRAAGPVGPPEPDVRHG
jgi:ribosomal protein S18 acetylase RimI-like enzyme